RRRPRRRERARRRRGARAVPPGRPRAPGGTRGCRTPAAPGGAWHSAGPAPGLPPARGPRAGRARRRGRSSRRLRQQRVALAHGGCPIHLHRLRHRLVARMFDANRVATRCYGVLDDRRLAHVGAVDVHLAEGTREVYIDGTDVGQTPIVEYRSEEHTSELQSRFDLVCRLLLEKQTNLRLRKRCRPTPPPAADSFNVWRHSNGLLAHPRLSMVAQMTMIALALPCD